jgi:hypothetical protein
MKTMSRRALLATLCLAVLGPRLALAAGTAGSNRCGAAEQRQFDFWVGEWSGIEKQPQEPQPVTRIEVRVEKILGGCALLERNDLTTKDSAFSSVTLRAYDKDRKAWGLHYFDDLNQSFQAWGGALVDGHWQFSRERMVDGKKMLVRVVWTVVSNDSVTWRIERSADGGGTWTPRSVVEFSRKG